MENRTKILFTKISKKQAGDTGMAMVLILLLTGFFTQNNIYYKIAIPVLLINMIIPMFYYPFAIIWLGFSHLLGTIVSKIILTIIFFIFVVPVGLFRKLIGIDTLKLNKFKNGKESSMKIRNYKFSPSDIEKPY